MLLLFILDFLHEPVAAACAAHAVVQICTFCGCMYDACRRADLTSAFLLSI